MLYCQRHHGSFHFSNHRAHLLNFSLINFALIIIVLSLKTVVRQQDTYPANVGGVWQMWGGGQLQPCATPPPPFRGNVSVADCKPRDSRRIFGFGIDRC